jgi:Effector Associated Constant Component 1
MEVPMKAEIQVSRGDDVSELSNLYGWLRAERGLTGAVGATPRPPGETELGGAYGVLAVALGSGGAGVTLAKSLTTWLQARHSNVAITVSSPSGSITLEARQVRERDVLPLLSKILRASDDS